MVGDDPDRRQETAEWMAEESAAGPDPGRTGHEPIGARASRTSAAPWQSGPLLPAVFLLSPTRVSLPSPPEPSVSPTLGHWLHFELLEAARERAATARVFARRDLSWIDRSP